MPANNNKSYIGHSNKLVDEYNDTYHRSSGKKRTNNILHILHLNIFTEGDTDNLSKEIFLIDSVLKTNPWM